MQPYEKFLRFGATKLSNEELLAIIIRTGTRDKSALTLAGEILTEKNTKSTLKTSALDKEAGQLSRLHHLSVADLMRFQGIGEVKAVKIKCITELSARLSKESFGMRPICSNPETVASIFMEECRHLESEQVILLCLNNKMQLVSEHILSTGTVNSSLLSPRDVFITAVREKAVYILLLHNHPSGDTTPSIHDISITKKIFELGNLLEIPLVDHIIIGDNTYVSMKEKKII